MQTRPPVLTDALMAYLNSTYPEQSPNPTETDREIWMKAGARRLVRDLQILKEVMEANPEDF